MKKILASIIVCFVAIAATAQTADIEVSYNYKHFGGRPISSIIFVNFIAGRA